MKQIPLIASVLVGGALAGAAGVVAVQAFKPSSSAQPPHPAAQTAQPATLTAAPAASPVVASLPTAAKPAPVHERYAKILSVTPIKRTAVKTRQVCHQEPYHQQAPVKDGNRVAGSVLGGVLGGVLGHQIGGGNGKTAATVAGALAGGYAGNQAQKTLQQRDQVSGMRTLCTTEQVPVDKVVAYTVRYSLDGKTGTLRMPHRPKGKTLPARDGQLI